MEHVLQSSSHGTRVHCSVFITAARWKSTQRRACRSSETGGKNGVIYPISLIEGSTKSSVKPSRNPRAGSTLWRLIAHASNVCGNKVVGGSASNASTHGEMPCMDWQAYEHWSSHFAVNGRCCKQHVNAQRFLTILQGISFCSDPVRGRRSHSHLGRHAYPASLRTKASAAEVAVP